MLGSTQQVARILFEKLELTAGRKGKTGYSTDAKVLRSIRGDHALVPVIEEWRELSKLLNTYLGPLPALIDERRAACTRRSTRRSPRPAASRRRARTCRRSRSAPSSGARSAPRSSPRTGASCSRPTTRRSSCASSRTSRASRSCGGVRARRGHPPRDRGRGARQGSGDADDRRARDREDDQLRDRLRHLGLRALGEPRDPARAGAGVHRRLPRALPARAGLHRAHDRAGEARRLRHVAARPAPARARDPRVEPADPLARRAARRQLRHAGLERGHHQGRDDRASTTACARRAARARLVLQVHDELLLEVPDAEVQRRPRARRAPRCAAPTTSTRRSRSTSASARTGPRPRARPPGRVAGGWHTRAPVAVASAQ